MTEYTLDSWTSIVRGAVLKGLENRSQDTRLVLSRKSGVSLGVSYYDNFQEGVHRVEYK